MKNEEINYPNGFKHNGPTYMMHKTNDETKTILSVPCGYCKYCPVAVKRHVFGKRQIRDQKQLERG